MTEIQPSKRYIAAEGAAWANYLSTVTSGGTRDQRLFAFRKWLKRDDELQTARRAVNVGGDKS